MLQNNYPLTLKSHDDAGYFYGYASIFNQKDLHGDVICPGAFEHSLQKHKPKMLWQHDPKKPIGFFECIEETKEGLFVKGKILLEVHQGKEAHILMKQGIIDSLSIGFYVEEASHEKDMRFLHRLSLQEISLVTFPAAPLAKIISKAISTSLIQQIKRLSKKIETQLDQLK